VGLLALLLTLSGIYGILSFLVSQRTKEIGIRLALGATPRAVTALVLAQSMKLAVIGAVAGAALAMALSRVLAASFVMIHAFDVVGYIGGMGLVLTACGAAAYFASRRPNRPASNTAL